MATSPKTPKINHGGNRTRMDDLDDHMLTQILLRLPNSATVLARSLVNKRWCSLISDPTFRAQFTNHRKKITTLLIGSGSGSDHEDDEPHWDLITTMQSSEHPFITIFMFGFRELSLKFLPFKTCTTTVTFKDLVLCSNYWAHEERGRLVYYITNPITKQWVALPPCPVKKHRWEEDRIKRTALICQQPYNYTQHYKFRVVEVRNPCIDSSQETLGLVVYCSEIGEWKEIKLRVPKEFRELETTVVCNGIIYFKSGLSLIALDPFDVNVACDTTLEAQFMPPLPDFGYLQESSGQLLVVYSPNKRRGSPCLYYRKDGRVIEMDMVMWKLDPNQARLVWERTFQGMCKGTWKSSKLPCNIALIGDIIEVHPYNDKLIYMLLPTEDRFALCDTQTGYITPLKSLPTYSLSRIHRLEHQWWPTSVPALVQPHSRTELATTTVQVSRLRPVSYITL